MAGMQTSDGRWHSCADRRLKQFRNHAENHGNQRKTVRHTDGGQLPAPQCYFVAFVHGFGGDVCRIFDGIFGGFRNIL